MCHVGAASLLCGPTRGGHIPVTNTQPRRGEVDGSISRGTFAAVLFAAGAAAVLVIAVIEVVLLLNGG